MHKRLLYVGSAAVSLLAGCQASKPAATTAAATGSGAAIETLGPVVVPAREFAYVYRKNNGSAPEYGTKASVQEYLDLYTNFRLKVLEAEKRGLDTTQAFKRELDGYRQQLAQPYLTEKSVTDQLVREAYERMQQEISAAHILVRVAPDAVPADTLAAYQKISQYRQQVTGGEDFAKLAGTVSEDPSARENGGKLGYFTAMQMVYPFETAAYKTPVGQVSPPVRTRFGYHIIKVNDRRPAQGEIKVAHLMVRLNAGAPKADSATARKKIDELYSRLRKGESWDKLVAQFSEDAGSAANSGELPPFGTGRMIPAFEEVAFKLQKPGDIAAPVQTPYGFHVIKLLEKQPVAKFADLEPSLKGKVAKDSRSELNRAAFLKRIRTENQFLEIPAARSFAFAKADTALVKGRFKYTPVAVAAGKGGRKSVQAGSDNVPLFTIKAQPYLVKDFLAFVQANQRPRPTAQPAFVMQQFYDQYVDQSLTEFEKNNLDTKYEDYRMLVKEYRDGILLFQLMDEKVWSKAIEDTVGLRKFFAANQGNYQWGQRAQGTLISAASPQLLARAQRELATGRYRLTRGVPAAAAFSPNSDKLTKAGAAALDEVGQRLSADTLTAVTFTGRGRKGEPASLAARRAKAAVAYLTQKGFGSARQLRTAPKAAAGGAAAVEIALTSTNPTALEAQLNERNPLAVQISQRTFQQGDNKVMDAYLNRAPGTYTTQQDGRYYVIKVNKALPAGPKTLADARGQATSDYQTYLEKEWIGQLRQQYPVQVNEAEVGRLVTK
ncbi:peptidylprolyl isomerase [uncultured Hymenobacter sp.]|uniref:peptidylprolyl isomerase n=1 Tax=uncultured Hymenobacter sp. TaxID=170016 RepID=UPI0035C95E6E